MKKLLLASAAVLGLASAANAADLPRRAVMASPVAMAPAFSWNGVYAGVSAGYVWSDARARFTGATGAFAAAPFAGTFQNMSLEGDGFILGGQVGGNMQFGMFVLGLEGDISYTDIGATSTAAAAGAVTTTVSSDLEYLGTIRGRLGLAFDRFMIYGTGGFAFGGTDNRGTIAAATGRTDPLSTGWAAGVGGEFAFTDNMTFRLEWLHYNLSDENVAIGNGASTVSYNFRNEGDIVRGGINFKF